MGKISNRKSATKWDQSSEWAFLEVWSGKVEELRGCRKNSHILLEMVAELKAQGYVYTVIELKTKMHNMTARYRRENQKIKNGGSPSQWELYDQIGILLAQYNRINNEDPVVDSINSMHLLDPLIAKPSPSPSPPPTPPSPGFVHSSPSSYMSTNSPSSAASSTAGRRRKKGLENIFKCVLKNMEKIHYDIKNTSERMIAIEEERVKILKAYVDREAEVQNALVNFLNSN